MVLQGTLDEITDDLMETTAADTAAVNVSYTTANEAPVTASDTIPDEVRESLVESAQSLNQAYPDAIGWLYIPNTNISYPVSQGRDNEYYLSHAYDGSSLSAGAIFLDCRCENRFMNPVNILYGHSMLPLADYYCKSCKYAQVNCESGNKAIGGKEAAYHRAAQAR